MKVLGFINRYSRGVQTVQEKLKNNGNGIAEFQLNLGTAFLVVERIKKLKQIGRLKRESGRSSVKWLVID